MDRGWRFRRRQGCCAECGNAFVDGEAVFSLLRLAEGVLDRGDLCAACFDRRSGKGEVCWWRTDYRPRGRRLVLDFELLLGLVGSLAADRRPACMDLRFLLALLLVRQRRLRLAGVRGGRGGERLLLRRPRSKRVFEVAVRDLSGAQADAARAALAALLDPDREAGPEEVLAGLLEGGSGEVVGEAGGEPDAAGTCAESVAGDSTRAPSG